MMKIAFAGFGEVNTPIEIIERKCQGALDSLMVGGAIVYPCFPITDDYEEKDVNKAIEYFKQILLLFESTSTHAQPDSTWQCASQPSPFARLPSSQPSP